MATTSNLRAWVVYLTNAEGMAGEVAGVCEQREWEAIRRSRPDRQTLVREGIASEAEAEKLARACTAGAKTGGTAKGNVSPFSSGSVPWGKVVPSALPPADAA